MDKCFKVASCLGCSSTVNRNSTHGYSKSIFGQAKISKSHVTVTKNLRVTIWPFYDNSSIKKHWFSYKFFFSNFGAKIQISWNQNVTTFSAKNKHSTIIFLKVAISFYRWFLGPFWANFRLENYITLKKWPKATRTSGFQSTISKAPKLIDDRFFELRWSKNPSSMAILILVEGGLKVSKSHKYLHLRALVTRISTKKIRGRHLTLLHNKHFSIGII